MKIILVSSEQFQTIWRRLIPSERIHGNINHPSIVLAHLDAVLVLNENLKIGSIPASITIAELSPSRLDEIVRNDECVEVG